MTTSARYHAARAFDADTARNDAAALVFLIDTEGQGDDGHGGTVRQPAAWDSWDATRRQRWAGAVVRRVANQGSRMGRTTREDGTMRGGAHHADLSAAIDYADMAPSVARVIEARETVKAALVLADPLDRATILGLAEVIGARVWDTDQTDYSARRAHTEAARVDPRSGLPFDSLRRLGLLLGISRKGAAKRFARVIANVGPVVEALRTSGKLRVDAKQRSAVLAAIDAATVPACGI